MLASTDLMDTPQTRFAALLDTHRGIVLKVANTYCRHPQDRQDLAQEIAAQLWRSFSRYDPARAFSTWMYRIALNVAISYVRSNMQRERHTASINANANPIENSDIETSAGEYIAVSDHGDQHEQDERIRALYAVIDRLDALDRALMLLWLEDRSQREIAEVIGISETNVASKLNRLKLRIRQQLVGHNTI